MNNTHLFTSESVSEGHPDKLADQISDAILDAYLARDPMAKIACETLVAHGAVILAGEIYSETADLNGQIEHAVRETIKTVGYTAADLGLDYSTCEFQNRLHTQSGNIRECVEKDDGLLGAGDQGLMFGYATTETPALMPLPIWLSHKLVRCQSELRKNGTLPWLGPDAKSQVTIRYDGTVPVAVEKVVLSTQHRPEIDNREIREAVIDKIIIPSLSDSNSAADIAYYVNPSGRFEIGGPEADAGLTGRKIIVDTYGGSCPHGGGAFSGKDATKVDRSAAYAARHAAKNIVAAGLADRCTIQLAYAIGQVDPVSLMLQFHGTGQVNEIDAAEKVREIFDFTPAGIIKSLDLRKPIFKGTAAYGHFGRDPERFPWERTNKVKELKNAFNI